MSILALQALQALLSRVAMPIAVTISILSWSTSQSMQMKTGSTGRLSNLLVKLKTSASWARVRGL